MLEITVYYASSSMGLPTYGNSGIYGALTNYSLETALSPDLYTFPSSSSSPFYSYVSSSSYTYPNGTRANDTSSFSAFRDGCQRKTGTPNCTDACGIMADVLGDFRTLHNCLLLPNITTTDNQTVTARISSSTGWSEERGTDILDQQYYQPAANESGTTFTENLGNCLFDYCNTMTGCSNQFRDYYGAFNVTSGLFGQRGQGYYLVDSICSNMPIVVESDVGGIGVYLSYWIQSGLALLGFLMTIFWMVLGQPFYLMVYFLSGSYDRALARSGKAGEQAQKHLSRLAVALVDFQKAQCFFMLATNIAALIVIQSAGLQPGSMQQIYNTYFFLRLVAASGYLPITFTLFNLHILELVSWYILILSSCTIFLGMGSLFALGQFNPSKADLEYLRVLFDNGGPESCAFKNPGVYCLKQGINRDSGSPSILAFCIVVWLFIVLLKLKPLYWKTLRPKLRSALKAGAILSRKLFNHPRMVPIKERLKETGKSTASHLRLKVPSKQFSRTPTAPTYEEEQQKRSPSTTPNADSPESLPNDSVPSSEDTYSERAPVSTRMRVMSEASNHYKAMNESWLQYNPRHTFDLNPTGATANAVNASLSTWDRLKNEAYRHYVSLNEVWIQYRPRHTLDITPRQILRGLFPFTIYILLSIFFLKFFYNFLALLASFGREDGYNTTWNFGQVVALSVWLPPICEYVYLEMRGVRKGFEYRLRKRKYRIIGVNESKVDLEKGGRAGEEGKLEDPRSRDGDNEVDLKRRKSVQRDDGFEDIRLINKDEEDMGQVHRRSASEESRPSSLDDERSIAESVKDTSWILPEPELPSRTITLSRHWDDGPSP